MLSGPDKMHSFERNIRENFETGIFLEDKWNLHDKFRSFKMLQNKGNYWLSDNWVIVIN